MLREIIFMGEQDLALMSIQGEWIVVGLQWLLGYLKWDCTESGYNCFF